MLLYSLTLQLILLPLGYTLLVFKLVKFFLAFPFAVRLIKLVNGYFSFSANPSILSFLLQDWLHRFPVLFTHTSEHVRCLLFTFFFSTFSGFWFRAVDLEADVSRLLAAR